MEVQDRQAVKYMIGAQGVSFASNEDLTESDLKQQFRDAEKRIKDEQQDGYILMKDVVYKVYKAGTPTGKITGEEAKLIKRKLRAL